MRLLYYQYYGNKVNLNIFCFKMKVKRYFFYSYSNLLENQCFIYLWFIFLEKSA